MTTLLPYDVAGGIATLTLNRPEKHNAINYAMADQLMAALDAIESNAAVRAVILTGAGQRAFCAGGDIHEFSQSVREGPTVAMREFVRRGQTLTSRIEAFSKPVIVAVNGLAYGGAVFGGDIGEAGAEALQVLDQVAAERTEHTFCVVVR